jgi:hypothetical protein
MAKSKRKPDSPFTDRWRITSMSAWDNDYLDEEEPAYIAFDAMGAPSRAALVSR